MQATLPKHPATRQKNESHPQVCTKFFVLFSKTEPTLEFTLDASRHAVLTDAQLERPRQDRAQFYALRHFLSRLGAFELARSKKRTLDSTSDCLWRAKERARDETFLQKRADKSMDTNCKRDSTKRFSLNALGSGSVLKEHR